MRNFIKITLAFCFVLCSTVVLAQSGVSGKVVDSETGTPLPGVNVIIQGTSTGVSTDFDGNYQISVPQGAVLDFSFIGFENQSITVNGDQIDVTLVPSADALDEIVVTGYGTQTRREVTGSIVSIGSESIEKIATGSGVDAIKGQVSGVDITSGGGRPGQNPVVRVRGRRSISASNDPLYVIDGIPQTSSTGDGAIFDINPQDIESMEILKDAVIYQVYTTDQYNQVIFPSLNKWIDNTRPNRQHTQGQRDFILMRLADAYLIRAEANLKQGNTAQAAEDLNIVRKRGAWDGEEASMEITAADVDIDFILDERARELVGEGHRWFDLVRTKKLVERVKAHNLDATNNIQSYHVLRPIPLDQIDRTEGGYPQNTGYTQ